MYDPSRLMKRLSWILAGVGLVVAGGATLYLSGMGSRFLIPMSAQVSDDAVGRFLAAHWRDPLPPQGEPPLDFTALEASLAPEACGQCHTEQQRDWRDSLHSRAIGPGILWQFRMMDQQSANGCMRCHAPLAEQKALMAIELGWPGAPSTVPPPYVSERLHREGLVCAVCHVRAHARFGPPARRAVAAPPPHGGFRAEPAFQDSRFCAVCHQFPESGSRLNGKLLENTYQEWRGSDSGRTGTTCQSCHMPDRRHLWRGIHDPEMTARALTVALDIVPWDSKRMRAEARIANTGAGHHFPTYVVPEVVFTLQLVHVDGRQRGEIARTVVAREVDIDLTRELFDTRLAAGETRILSGEFGRPVGRGWGIELRMVVSPGAHYERSFARALGRIDKNSEAASLLREALVQLRSGRYSMTLARRAL